MKLSPFTSTLTTRPAARRIGAERRRRDQGAETKAPRPGADWPSFRGARAAGVAEGFTTPTEWNVPEGKNLLFKTAIPGLGHSSPIVWGDRVYVTTAIAVSGAEQSLRSASTATSTAPPTTRK